MTSNEILSMYEESKLHSEHLPILDNLFENESNKKNLVRYQVPHNPEDYVLKCKTCKCFFHFMCI
jgi:hypothetical protein